LFGHDYSFAITIAENGEPFVREARCLQFNSSLLRQIKKHNKMRTFVAFFLARPKELESPTFCSGVEARPLKRTKSHERKTSKTPVK